MNDETDGVGGHERITNATTTRPLSGDEASPRSFLEIGTGAHTFA
jgi:hypothetical protein